MGTPRPRSRQPKQLDAGIFQAEISSFALRLAAEGQGRQDDPDLHRGGPVVRRRPPAQPGQLGAGQQPGHPAVDGMAAGPPQQRLRQQPVPGLAAVLQMASRRRRATRPDGRAAAAARHRQAGPGLHARGAGPAGAGVRGPQLRPAPRYRDHRGIHRRPASGCPNWPASSAATSTCGSGRSRSAAKTGSSGSATRLPGAWTGTSAPAPGTRRPGGRSYGSEPATGSR